VGRAFDQVVEEGCLARTGFAAHHQCPALARPDRVEQLVEHPTLAVPVKHDETADSA
jgi:hypothetical protein